MRPLLKICMTSPRHLMILIGHWLLHAYGIIALTRMENPSFHAPLIALVPFPGIFYILTVAFTDPDNLETVWHCSVCALLLRVLTQNDLIVVYIVGFLRILTGYLNMSIRVPHTGYAKKKFHYFKEIMKALYISLYIYHP